MREEFDVRASEREEEGGYTDLVRLFLNEIGRYPLLTWFWL